MATTVNTVGLENQIIQGLLSTPSLRDWQHASKIFTPGSFALVPKFSFNFYVYFDYDPQPFGLQTPTAQSQMIGALCKTAQLPKFTFEHKTMNAYNRADKIQTKVKYEPVTLKFHDDSSDIVRNFWYDYYSFFYRDADYSPEIYQMKTKYSDRQKDKWGYTPRPEANGYIQGYGQTSAYNGGTGETNYNPLRAIRIYSMSRKNFSEYVLLNPMITAFQHGEHQMEGSTLMEHQMTIEYQAVKYYKGRVSDQEFSSSFLLLYDQETSPLRQAGFGGSVFGTGGTVDSLTKVGDDLANGNGALAALDAARTIQQIKQNGGIQNMLAVEAQTAIPQLIQGTYSAQTQWSAPAPADAVSVNNNDSGIASSPPAAAAAAEASAISTTPQPIEQSPPVSPADAKNLVTSDASSVLSTSSSSSVTTVAVPDTVPAVVAAPTVADLQKQSDDIRAQIIANNNRAFDPTATQAQRDAAQAAYSSLIAQQTVINNNLYRAQQQENPTVNTGTVATGVRTVVITTSPIVNLNAGQSSTDAQQGAVQN